LAVPRADEAVADFPQGFVHLGPEPVQRAVLAARIEHPAQDGAVAVEVAREQGTHATDRAVAPVLVKELLHELLKCAAVAEKALEGARQVTLTVGEGLAERAVERAGGLLVDLMGPVHQPFEFFGDEIDVERHARVAQGDEAHAQRSLDEIHAIPLWKLGEVAGELGVSQGDLRHDDVVAIDLYGWPARHSLSLGCHRHMLLLISLRSDGGSVRPRCDRSLSRHR